MNYARKTAGALLLGALSLGLAAAPAQADETTFCNAYITTLPYTITTQGHYCFNKNLSTAITTGAAITINTDFVVLDLNNFKLGGGSAGPGTRTIGVYAAGRSNLTIRNGNIRGFLTGIQVDKGSTGSVPQNVVVENNTLDGNTLMGAAVFAQNLSIRNNAVSNIGGSTLTPLPHCGHPIGISTTPETCDDQGVGEVINNVLTGIGDGTKETVAIKAILSIVQRNRILGDNGLNGQFASIEAGVCDSNTVIDGKYYLCLSGCVGENFENDHVLACP